MMQINAKSWVYLNRLSNNLLTLIAAPDFIVLREAL